MDSSFSSGVSIPQKNALFLSGVWTYFGLAIAVSALGAWAAPLFVVSSTTFWAVIIAHLALMLSQSAWGNSKTFGVPVFFLFAFLSGAVLYPLLAFAGATGQIGVVFQALIASASLFFAAAVWGYTTKKDLSGMGQFLFFAMIGLFVVGIMNIFFFTSIVHTIASVLTVIVFSGYTSYDLQMIKNGAYESPVYAALHLFINMFAIFQNLLSLFLSE